MALRKHGRTKEEIDKLKRVGESQSFFAELTVLLEEFRQGDNVKDCIADFILGQPLHKATSVTWIVYEVCNCFNDHELERDWLSELVVDIEDLVEGIEKIIEKYL